MDLIFCLGIAAVYTGVGIIVAISIGAEDDLEGDLMLGAFVIFWPIILIIVVDVCIGVQIIELFRRKK